MFRKLAATVAVSTALMTSQAWSLGLGELKTESGLNQPLSAEIVLLSSKELQESDLRAKIASFEAYERYGVIREPFHSLLRFEVYTKSDGSKAVRVSSDSPVKEPYVNIIIELEWPQGKLMREYTLLLDPPIFNKTTPVISAEPAQTIVTPTQRPSLATQEVKRMPESTPEPKPQESTQVPQEQVEAEPAEKAVPELPAQPDSAPAVSQRRSAPVFDGNNWSVGRGQTLWSIAQKVRPNNATVQQTLIALYRSNPDAFINDDVNRLKAGAQLKVPDKTYIDSITHAEALSEYRASLAGSQAPLDVRKTVTETESRAESNTQGGRLSIASVEDSSLNQAGGSETDSNSVDELQNEVSSLREAVETLKLQNQQLKEELETKDDIADTGIKVGDDTLAVLSGSAEVADNSLPIEPESSESEVAEEQSSPKAISEQSEMIAEESDKETKPQTLPTTNSKPKDSFYQAEGFWYWAGGGLLALLAMAGGAVYWRNRKPPEDNDSGLVPNFGGGSDKKEPRDSFLSKDKMTLDEETSSPLEEADILIARGKMTQANSVLETALKKEPDNDAVRVKYMEILASQKNAEKFYELKHGLSKDFDHDSKLGLKVASLSSLVGPEKVAEPVAKPSATLPDEDDVFSFSEQNDNKDVNVDLTEELEITDEPDVDTTSTSEPLDFDLTEFDKEIEETSKQDKVDSQVITEDTKKGEDSLDFSLDLDDESLVTQESDLTSEVDAGSSSGDSDDEVQTKLELAKAYLEMGDEESAKEILLEVEKEGNSTQSEEATKLLAKK